MTAATLEAARIHTAIDEWLESQPGVVRIIGWRPNEYGSTFQSTFVDALTDGGETVRLFVKWGETYLDPAPCHTRGIRTEAGAYRSLKGVGYWLPAFIGEIPIDASLDAVVTRHVPGVRLPLSVRPEDVVRSSRELALLHEAAAERSLPNRYDESCLQRWVDFAEEALSVRLGDHRWIFAALDGIRRDLSVLAARPEGAVHGELYPENVLVTDESVYFLDWETAGRGPGEFDLGFLTYGWPDEMRARCERVYAEARGIAPAEPFRDAVAVARMFAAIRGLVHWKNFAASDAPPPRAALAAMGAVLQRFGDVWRSSGAIETTFPQ